MPRSISSDNTFSILASVGTILVSVLTALSIFFPDWITNTAQQAINLGQYRGEGGVLRPGVVSAQVNVFLVAIFVFSIIAGLALVGAYYWSTRLDASSVVVGRGHNKKHRYFVLVLIGILCILAGSSIPRAIFNPTDVSTRMRDFGFAAWALRSHIGGFVLGILIFFLSMVIAVIFFVLLVKTPWHLRKNKIQKAFAQ